MKGHRTLIIGNKKCGKGTAIKTLGEVFGVGCMSSSYFAVSFVRDLLSLNHGIKYNDNEECYNDRDNHRQKWFDIIREYNKDDNARLVKEMIKEYDVIDGIRSIDEFKATASLFHLIIYLTRPGAEADDTNQLSPEIIRNLGYNCVVINNENDDAEYLKKQVINVYRNHNPYPVPVGERERINNARNRKSAYRRNKRYTIYWLHIPGEHTDPYSQGYIGFTSQDLAFRFLQHKENPKNSMVREAIANGAVMKPLVEGLSKFMAYETEYKYRPLSYTGMNIMPGGHYERAKRIHKAGLGSASKEEHYKAELREAEEAKEKGESVWEW